jgi:uncharacterized protein (DUF1800 family)
MADKLLPLDKLDPAEVWKPWRPDNKDPWGPRWAGHLYRRAAFGANPVELRQAVEAGPAATIDLLLKGQPDNEGVTAFLNTKGEQVARRDNINELRSWWLYCMLNSRHPLREKMTLFWHNHFVSSIDKVGRTMVMFNQNRLLRQHALARFGPFVLDISKDAAMLVYLDSNSNVKSHPNENYARELMELFCLGVGNYTETDVREAARAFTGWHTDGDGFEFVAPLHDPDPKTLLGTTGPLDGGDAVDILLHQPVCARFVVGKLYRYLISENQEPPAALLEPLADQFRKSDYDIAALLGTMLSSRHFFSPYAFRQRIKSPVEFVLGAARATVQVKLDPETKKYNQFIPQESLVARIEATGQNLFAPPNVKGWRMGPAWLNTATMLARQNFGQALAMGTLWQGGLPNQNAFEAVPVEAPVPPGTKPKVILKPEEPAPAREYDPATLVLDARVTGANDVVRVLLDAYLPGGINAEATQKLVAFVAQGNPQGAALQRRVREAVQAIVAMPDYQMA